MDFLIELIVELLFEGAVEGSKSKRLPKGLRYFLFAIISMIFLFTSILLFYIGIVIPVPGGIKLLLLALGIFCIRYLFVLAKKVVQRK